jgi:hypothetical protein
VWALSLEEASLGPVYCISGESGDMCGIMASQARVLTVLGPILPALAPVC